MDGDSFDLVYTLIPDANELEEHTTLEWPHSEWSITEVPSMVPVELTYLDQQIPPPPGCADQGTYTTQVNSAAIAALIRRCGSTKSLWTAGVAHPDGAPEPQGTAVERVFVELAGSLRAQLKYRRVLCLACLPTPSNTHTLVLA